MLIERSTPQITWIKKVMDRLGERERGFLIDTAAIGFMFLIKGRRWDRQKVSGSSREKRLS